MCNRISFKPHFDPVLESDVYTFPTFGAPEAFAIFARSAARFRLSRRAVLAVQRGAACLRSSLSSLGTSVRGVAVKGAMGPQGAPQGEVGAAAGITGSCRCWVKPG